MSLRVDGLPHGTPPRDWRSGLRRHPRPPEALRPSRRRSPVVTQLAPKRAARLDATRPGRGNGEGNARTLHTARVAACFVGRVVAPAPRGLALAQQQVREGHELVEAVCTFARRPRLLAKDRRVPAEAAGADAEREPPVREVIERNQLARERDGVPKVGRRDERPDPNALRSRAPRPKASAPPRTRGCRGASARRDDRT